MSKPLVPTVLLILLSISVLFDRPEGRALADDATAKPSANADDPKADKDSLALQYAKMYLKLSQVDLKRANETNQRVQGTIPPAVMDELNDTLSAAEARIKSLEQQPDAAQASLKALEVSAQSAKRRYEKAQAANRVSSGAVTPGQMERFKVLSELADLRIKRTIEVQQAPREEQIQWLLELLREDISSLKMASALFRDRN